MCCGWWVCLLMFGGRNLLVWSLGFPWGLACEMWYVCVLECWWVCGDMWMCLHMVGGGYLLVWSLGVHLHVVGRYSWPCCVSVFCVSTICVAVVSAHCAVAFVLSGGSCWCSGGGCGACDELVVCRYSVYPPFCVAVVSAQCAVASVLSGGSCWCSGGGCGACDELDSCSACGGGG